MRTHIIKGRDRLAMLERFLTWYFDHPTHKVIQLTMRQANDTWYARIQFKTEVA